MKSIRKSAIAAIAVAGILLSGCSNGAGGTQDGADGSNGALAMTFAGLDIQIWVDQLAIMKPIIEDAGYEFLTNDPGWDIQTQVADTQAWIQRGDVRAIMAYPVQSDSMIAVTQEALAASIPVVGYAVKWEGVEYALVIDNYQDGLVMGREAGQWIIDNYGTSAAVPVTLFSYWDNDLGRDRTQGVLDGLEEVGANVSINEIPALTLDDGYAGVQSALSANPETRVWLSVTSDGMLGGYQALIDSGVDPQDPKVMIASLDATNAILDILQDPDSIWRFGYILPAQELAENNAHMLIAAAEGTLDADINMTSTRITTENVDSFYTGR